MTISVENVVATAKANVDSILISEGAIDNTQALEAVISAILDEILLNGEVVVTGGSSAGTYKIT